MNALAWMAAVSTAGRLNSGSTPERPIRATITEPGPIVAEQWDGRQWVARKLVWNGSSYVPEAA